MFGLLKDLLSSFSISGRLTAECLISNFSVFLNVFLFIYLFF